MCPQSDEDFYVRCPQNYTLALNSVSYGHNPDWTCAPDGTASTGSCEDPLAAVVLRELCEGQTECRYKVEQESFGNQCNLQEAVLTVSFTCRRECSVDNLKFE